MKKVFAIVLFISSEIIFAQPKFSPISSMPGAFSRMGFGARGIGMGNAMSAVTEGNLVSYYNPALTVFQENNSFQTSYTFLSLDRSLNFLNFTRRFDFYSTDSLGNKVVRSSAGISLGVINSGVSNIDGRDGQGFQTGNLSTSENQFFLALANRFSQKFSLGMSFKFYYYKLYRQISSTGFGLDIGALYRLNDQWNISFMISDLNSKYNWDTTPIYQQSGTTTVDKFPLLKKVGVSYTNKNYGIIAAMELESSNGGSNILRAGVEYNIYKGFYLRGGLDQFNLSNSDNPAQPSLGFSYFKNFGGIVFGVDYAFVIESYSPGDEHVIGLNINF
ncbi:MAG: PorV/PorQ family protein [Ignavibacteriaceae bacterium]